MLQAQTPPIVRQACQGFHQRSGRHDRPSSSLSFSCITGKKAQGDENRELMSKLVATWQRLVYTGFAAQFMILSDCIFFWSKKDVLLSGTVPKPGWKQNV